MSNSAASALLYSLKRRVVAGQQAVYQGDQQRLEIIRSVERVAAGEPKRADCCLAPLALDRAATSADIVAYQVASVADRRSGSLGHTIISTAHGGQVIVRES